MTSEAPLVRHVVGVMTGTSIDGIDASVVRLEGRGLAMRASLVKHFSRDLGLLGPRLRAAAEQQPMTAGEFATLAWEFGQFHAEVIAELLATSLPLPPGEGRGEGKCGNCARTSSSTIDSNALTPNPSPGGRGGLDVICAHGQTVFHKPPVSWQLFNPAPIAARFNCPVITDLRQADLAARGQGAPITPIADWVLFRSQDTARGIVNLGGFCNVTVLPRADDVRGVDAIRGFDVCACNQVLDAVARLALNKRFDEHGAAAQTGRVTAESVDGLYDILSRQCGSGRSLGTGDETIAWAERWARMIAGPDLAASAVDGIARCMAHRLNDAGAGEIVLAGGGTRNLALVASLQRSIHAKVLLGNDLGIPNEARESVCFAILGALCADGVPITLPQVTGCKSPAPVAGSWTGPTRSPLARG